MAIHDWSVHFDLRRAVLRLLAAGLLLISMAGCTSWHEYVRNEFKVGPNYCRPAAPVAEDWIDARTEVGSKLISTAPPNDATWWRTFNDPVLDWLIQTAYRQNLSLRAAGMRVLEARAQRAIVAGDLFPQTQQVFGDYNRTALSRNAPNGPLPNRFFSEWTLGASMAWELDFWGRFRRAIEAADANLDASVENYDDALVVLLSEVAQRYLDLRTAEQRLAYARRNVEIQQRFVALATKRFQEGAVTRLDMTQGEATLALTQASLAPLETARRQAANQLCILLGIPPQNMDETLRNRLVGRIIPTAPAQVALGIPAELLRRRPDVRRAERDLAAQSARIGIATADLYPRISINGTLYLDAERFERLFESGSLAGNVGPSFRWDILNYGRLANNIRFQDARFQELAFQYQNLVLQANADAENALAGFLNAQVQITELQTGVRAAIDSLVLARIQYNAGKTDFNRVLNIEQLLTQQADQLAVAQGSVAQSLILLYRALGGGWQMRLSGPLPPLPEAAELPGEPETLPAPPAADALPGPPPLPAPLDAPPAQEKP